MNWTTLTRRTRTPKLLWIMRALGRVGVACRLNGESFHAPILEVTQVDFDRAWLVVDPIDNLADDDPMFADPASAQAWWLDVALPGIGITAGAVGLIPNKVRRAIVRGAKCSPDEDDAPFGCPFAVGKIERCPVDLWEACRPLARTETFLLDLAKALGADDDAAVALCETLFTALTRDAGVAGVDVTTYALAFCHRLAGWLAGDLTELFGRSPGALVEEVMRGVTLGTGTASLIGVDSELLIEAARTSELN